MSRDITTLRGLIDALDEDLVKLLAQRQKLVEEVIIYKKAHGIPAVIPDRIQAVLDHVGQIAVANGTEPELTCGIYKFMIDYFCRFEDRYLQEKNKA